MGVAAAAPTAPLFFLGILNPSVDNAAVRLEDGRALIVGELNNTGCSPITRRGSPALLFVNVPMVLAPGSWSHMATSGEGSAMRPSKGDVSSLRHTILLRQAPLHQTQLVGISNLRSGKPPANLQVSGARAKCYIRSLPGNELG